MAGAARSGASRAPARRRHRRIGRRAAVDHDSGPSATASTAISRPSDERRPAARDRQRHDAGRGRARRPSTGRCRRDGLAGGLPPRRDAAARHRATCSIGHGRTDRAWPPSSSGPVRARSRGSASVSRPPRASLTASGCRSSVSRPPRRCWPARRRAPCCCCRPGRRTGCSSAAARPASLVPAGTEPDLEPDETIVAVDLADRAPADEAARGETARAGLAAALLAIGADRLAAGSVDDLARLVPEYVTLPRGVRSESGEVAWSHDRP